MKKQQFLQFVDEFSESKTAVVCFFITLFFIFCALFAPQISPTDPYDLTAIRLSDAVKPVGAEQMTEGARVRANVAVTGGEGRAEATSETGGTVAFSVAPCGDGCLRLSVDSGDAVMDKVELRGLPRSVTVPNAAKHPILPNWTVMQPEGAAVEMTSDSALPASFDFDVVAATAPQATGFTFWLGTDGYGRDMLSAIFYGIRISIFIGLVAAGTAMLLGTMLGLISAWFGGIVDAAIMRTVDFMLGFPALLVGLVVLAALGKGVDRIVLAVVVVQWAYYARTARSVALSELGKEYIEAAKCLRFSAVRIMLKHILPNCLPPIIVILTIRIASAISLEASLSFLGVGLPLTQPSLGMLIANGYEYIFSKMYWISIYPGLVLLVMIVAMNLLGDRLRDVLNPRLKR